jgi:uncharacterized membrane protein HdeD (DUF308 family)
MALCPGVISATGKRRFSQARHFTKDERMDSNIPSVIPGSIVEDFQALRKNWGWLLAFGIASIIVGAMAVGSSMVATLATVTFFGVLIFVSGVVNILGSFWARAWGGFFLHLLMGVLYLAAGFIMVEHPAEAAVVYTLLLAVFFFVGGLFRLFGSMMGRFRNWGWMFFGGLVSVILGVMIWRQWPLSGLWVIGLFVGIDLLLHGWNWVMLALAAKSLPKA